MQVRRTVYIDPDRGVVHSHFRDGLGMSLEHTSRTAVAAELRHLVEIGAAESHGMSAHSRDGRHAYFARPKTPGQAAISIRPDPGHVGQRDESAIPRRDPGHPFGQSSPHPFGRAGAENALNTLTAYLPGESHLVSGQAEQNGQPTGLRPGQEEIEHRLPVRKPGEPLVGAEAL